MKKCTVFALVISVVLIGIVFSYIGQYVTPHHVIVVKNSTDLPIKGLLMRLVDLEVSVPEVLPGRVTVFKFRKSAESHYTFFSNRNGKRVELGTCGYSSGGRVIRLFVNIHASTLDEDDCTRIP